MKRRSLWNKLFRVFTLVTAFVLLGTVGLQAQAAGGVTLGINWMESKDLGILPPKVDVPILMYHNLVEDENDPSISKDTMWVGQFRREMELLEENGFHTISLDQLIDLAELGKALPEKPVLLTFDDGYSSVYELAFPILKEMNMQAVVFPIGVSVGKNTYKETGIPITPHFTWEQAKEMADSGLVSIQSHTYDMHQVAQFEGASASKTLRPNILRRPWETEKEYAQALLQDLNHSREDIQKFTGQTVTALSYPSGSYDALSEKLLASYGIKCTFTIHSGKATIQPGDPDSLFALNRFYVQSSTTDEEFLKWIK